MITGLLILLGVIAGAIGGFILGGAIANWVLKFKLFGTLLVASIFGMGSAIAGGVGGAIAGEIITAETEPTELVILSVSGTTVYRPEISGLENPKSLTWYIDKDGYREAETLARETSIDIAEQFTEPGVYIVSLYAYQGKKGKGDFVPISNLVTIRLEDQSSSEGGETNPLCAWANTIVGVWTYDHTSYLEYQPGGVGFHYSLDPNNEPYYLDTNGNTVDGKEQWEWKCLEDGRLMNVISGTTLPISFPDYDHYVLNGDRWNRVR